MYKLEVIIAMILALPQESHTPEGHDTLTLVPEVPVGSESQTEESSVLRGRTGMEIL